MSRTSRRDCDLVLAGGRVVDPESGLDMVTGVAISGGTVAAVGGSSGFRALFVDGQAVVRDGAPVPSALPGRAIVGGVGRGGSVGEKE